jgi:hypothetical protein
LTVSSPPSVNVPLRAAETGWACVLIVEPSVFEIVPIG